MQSLLEILRKTEGFFAQKGVESPRLNAELIFAHVLGLKRLELYLQFDRPLAEDVLEKARPLVARRAKREPLQYVLGGTEFFGLKLACDARALIPRPETEELAELLAEQLRKNPPARVLDLGTGTGALALALAKAFSQAQVWAADCAEGALALANENAKSNGLSERVRFFKTDWYEGLPEGEFDLIVSNPPYLTDAEWAEAAPEVKDYEPLGALTAAENGLINLNRILSGAPQRLRIQGWIALETGILHHNALMSLATARGLISAACQKDLHGRPRFFLAQKA